MKIPLTLAQIRDIGFLEGVALLRSLPLAGDEAVLLDRASQAIQDEFNRYHKLRNAYIVKNGTKKSEDRFEINAFDLVALKKLAAYEHELANEKITIRLVKKVSLAPEMKLSAAQYRALLDTGLIEPLDVKDPDPEPDETKSDPEAEVVPAAPAAPQSEAKVDPQPAGVPAPAETPDPEPAKLPAPTRNGHPVLKPKKPKSQLATR